MYCLVYNQKFYYNGYGTIQSWCYVSIYSHGDKYVVIMTEPNSNEAGTSVTNVVERIATDIYHKLLFNIKNPYNIIWIERYEKTKYFGETNDKVDLKFDVNNAQFHSPIWKRIGENITLSDMERLVNELA